ncbi:AAA family ATPase [Caldicellulosiruptor kronotskyensis]|uniref:hypothetical protein n=1 Tax=Caldicellulosiruptor kronotskyensis TaxID=413889 RepID=UPI0001E9AA9E|nr:hypothetical protein [Caldicellulosiruptor kronotskyensis]
MRENQETIIYQTKIDANKKLIAELAKTIEENKKRIEKLIQEKAFNFLLSPFVEKLETKLNSFCLSFEIVPKISTETIDYIIERGECLCGTKILKDSKEHRKLIELKEYLPPKYIGTAVSNFLGEASVYKDNGRNFFEEIKDLYGRILENKEEIRRLEDENEKNMKEIADKKNLKAYAQDKERWEKLKREKEQERNVRLMELGAIEKEIREKSKELENLSDKTDKNRFIKLCIKYVEYLSDFLEKFYKQKEEEIRKKLNEKVNDIFSKMYHGEDRKIFIDSNYDYQLITEYLSDQLKDRADESRGLETIMSFAFIGGIIQLAREKIINTGKSDSSVKKDDLNLELDTEPYPLVMDAPFSNVDEIHVENVSRILPEIAEQVIMFIMNKDWNYAQRVLADKVAAKYELEKVSETYTIIKEIR